MKVGHIYINPTNVDCVHKSDPQIGTIHGGAGPQCWIRYSGGCWDRVNLDAEEVAQMLGLDEPAQPPQRLHRWRDMLQGVQKKLGKPSRTIQAIIDEIDVLLEDSD